MLTIIVAIVLIWAIAAVVMAVEIYNAPLVPNELPVIHSAEIPPREDAPMRKAA
jgi:hypothetical protein